MNYTIGKESEYVQFMVSMMNETERLKTFTSWVFDESKTCNAAKLAEAGFYFIGSSNEPDAVQCFLCWKSLDGWEEADDPWEEHLKHSSNCGFMKLKKPMRKLTVMQYLDMQEELYKKCINYVYSEREKHVLEMAKAFNQKIAALRK